MSRVIHATTLANLQATLVRLALLFDFELDGANYYFWTGRHDLSYGGHTYLGNGYLEDFSSVDDSKERKSSGLQIVLSGIPSAMISAALSNGNVATECSLKLATLDANFAIDGTPIETFKGIIDNVEILNDGINPTLQLIYTGKYDDLDRYNERRYTASSQKELVAGDKGFDYVAQLQSWTGVWGKYKKKNTSKRR
jgi:hypothetical protein